MRGPWQRMVKESAGATGALPFLPSALTLKPEWLALILSGRKTWELRSRPCQQKGIVALLASGTSAVFGCCDIVGCRFRTHDELKEPEAVAKHGLSCEALHRFLAAHQGAYAWRLRRPRVLAAALVAAALSSEVRSESEEHFFEVQPLPVPRALGSVSWVRLTAQTQKRVQAALRGALQKEAEPGRLLGAMRDARSVRRIQARAPKAKGTSATSAAPAVVCGVAPAFVASLISEAVQREWAHSPVSADCWPGRHLLRGAPGGAAAPDRGLCSGGPGRRPLAAQLLRQRGVALLRAACADKASALQKPMLKAAPCPPLPSPARWARMAVWTFATSTADGESKHCMLSMRLFWLLLFALFRGLRRSMEPWLS